MSNTNINLFKWYVVYTYPNFEKKVRNHMVQKNIACFLPLQKVTRQWSDRKKIIEVPLFPNYIFVYIPNDERFKILGIVGVSRYIMYNNGPAIISDKEITIIKEMLMEPSVQVEKYLEGDIVEIIEGPFSGLKGTVFERKGKKRLGIKIKSLDQSLSAEFDISSIKRNKKIMQTVL